MNFTATIELDYLNFEIKVCLDEDGVNISKIYFGYDELTQDQLIYFINSYGSTDLDEEIMSQYNREQENIKNDKF